jgi:hypothetical protein
MKRWLILLAMFLFFSLTITAESDSSQEMIMQMNDQFFKVEKVRDFIAASDLFHYPPSYSIEEREIDEKAVISVLDYFSRSFGQIHSYKIPDNSEKYLYLSLSIGGGNLPYWSQNPNFIRTVYQVQFSNDGLGFVIIDTCNISNKCEIRSVHYGLPITKKDCQKRIQEIYDGMMEVLKALEQNKPKTA